MNKFSENKSAFQFVVSVMAVFILALGLFYTCLKLFDFSIGDAGSFMQGVFGGAVALAGSWVAIKLASIAISLQHEQQRAEEGYRDIEDKRASLETLATTSTNIERAYVTIAPILKGIQDSYVLAVVLDNRVLEFTKKHVSSGKLDDMPTNLSDEMKEEVLQIRETGTLQLVKHMRYLADSCRLHAIQPNPITAYLLKEACPKTIRIGTFSLSIASDFQTLGAIFDNYARSVSLLESLDDKDFIARLALMRVASFSFVDKNGKTFDHAGVRTWLTLSLTCSGSLDAANFFCDLLRSIPSGQMMADAIKKLLPTGMPPGLYEAVRNFDLISGLDGSVQAALLEFKELQPAMPSRRNEGG